MHRDQAPILIAILVGLVGCVNSTSEKFSEKNGRETRKYHASYSIGH